MVLMLDLDLTSLILYFQVFLSISFDFIKESNLSPRKQTTLSASTRPSRCLSGSTGSHRPAKSSLPQMLGQMVLLFSLWTSWFLFILFSIGRQLLDTSLLVSLSLNWCFSVFSMGYPSRVSPQISKHSRVLPWSALFPT